MAGRALARAAADILPELSATDLVRAGAGVRAQAVTRSGQLVDDFLFRRDGRALHVLNAPSPAATASIPIARLIADELLGRRDTACGRDDFDDH
jgi:L-2-hydroxyglutarate oxidase